MEKYKNKFLLSSVTLSKVFIHINFSQRQFDALELLHFFSVSWYQFLLQQFFLCIRLPFHLYQSIYFDIHSQIFTYDLGFFFFFASFTKEKETKKNQDIGTTQFYAKGKQKESKVFHFIYSPKQFIQKDDQ